MTDIREKKANPLADYPYHLPDKPLPVGPDGKVSYEDFFDWLDEDTLAEWVDGEVVMASPASRKHQDIAGFLYEVLKNFARVNDLGVIYQNPFQMKLPGKRGSGREPDLLFVAKPHLDRLENGLVRGPADLVVEVVSPESVERDREDKFKEYATGGVPEYWLIDTTTDEALFYRLNEGKQYQKVEPDGEGKYYSKVMAGLWLKPEWLWQEPLPSHEEVLLEVGSATYAQSLLEKLRKRGFLAE